MTLFAIVVPGNVYPVLTIGAKTQKAAEKIYLKSCKGNVPETWICLPEEEAKNEAIRLWQQQIFASKQDMLISLLGGAKLIKVP